MTRTKKKKTTTKFHEYFSNILFLLIRFLIFLCICSIITHSTQRYFAKSKKKTFLSRLSPIESRFSKHVIVCKLWTAGVSARAHLRHTEKRGYVFYTKIYIFILYVCSCIFSINQFTCCRTLAAALSFGYIYKLLFPFSSTRPNIKICLKIEMRSTNEKTSEIH